MNKYKLYVKEKLSEREILEQLAEEASELSQAALKCIRACGLSDNPTPVGQAEAMAKLDEEFTDVLMNMWLLLPLDYKVAINAMPECEKWQRWAERLGYKKHLP